MLCYDVRCCAVLNASQEAGTQRTESGRWRLRRGSLLLYVICNTAQLLRYAVPG
jgi:hypothetical protein